MQLVTDKRATHFWDGTRKLGDRYREVLKLPKHIRTAWDVYFAFDRSAEWKKVPPKPGLWMHQLYGVDKEKRLDVDKYRSGVQRLVRRSVEQTEERK